LYCVEAQKIQPGQRRVGGVEARAVVKDVVDAGEKKLVELGFAPGGRLVEMLARPSEGFGRGESVGERRRRGWQRLSRKLP
jgi:hypothetical protein